MVGSVNWTQVLVVGVPAYIAAMGAATAAVMGALNRRNLRTPSGDSIGQVVERAHDNGIANNLLLRAINGTTQPADPEQLHAADAEPPHVPTDQP